MLICRFVSCFSISSPYSLEVEADLAIVEDAEENYKVRADMKSEGWHYEYTLTRDVPNADVSQ